MVTRLKLFTPEEAAHLLGVPVQTMARWRVEGRGPVFVKLGFKVRYEPDEIEAWVVGQRRTSTSAKPAAVAAA